MKNFKILFIFTLLLGFTFSQTYRTTSDGLGGSRTTGSDGTSYRTTSDGLGGTRTTKTSSNWWD